MNPSKYSFAENKKWPRRTAIGSCAILLMAGTWQARAVPLPETATTKQEIADSDITCAVEDALVREKGPADVDVSTSDGIVTLSGTVDNIFASERADKIAESIRDVLGVVDLTTVMPVSRPDAAIRKDILAALLEDPATESYQVAVSVNDGVATLSGGVGSYAEKRLAERIAGGGSGVKKVTDDLAINYRAARTDQEIAADINARLQWDVWINGGSINVNVKNGAVTLTGSVSSAISRSRAYEDAWVNGVTAVNTKGLTVQPLASNETRRKFIASQSDSAVRKAVLTSFSFDPRVAAFSPNVTVQDGAVALNGTVGNVKARTAAEEDARNIAGVWQVENFLRVRPTGQRTDAQVQQQLKAALARDPLLDQAEIDAAVINHVAYLSGDVDSDMERDQAQDVASRTIGVAAVRNRLKVEPERAVYSFDWPYYSYDNPLYYNQPPLGLSDVFGPLPTDKQIKKKIEDELIWSPFVDRKDITITVDGGVATLTGTVGSWIGWDEANRDAHRGGAAYVIDRVRVAKHT